MGIDYNKKTIERIVNDFKKSSPEEKRKNFKVIAPDGADYNAEISEQILSGDFPIEDSLTETKVAWLKNGLQFITLDEFYEAMGW